MVRKILIIGIIAVTALTAQAEEPEQPRTVSVYRQHMMSETHKKASFDHIMHHMLYLSGAADAYAVLNRHRSQKGLGALYCIPEGTSLHGNDYLTIFETYLETSHGTLASNMPVSEALLQAMQAKFPCP
jgi:hypothetical protein